MNSCKFALLYVNENVPKLSRRMWVIKNGVNHSLVATFTAPKLTVRDEEHLLIGELF